jgi:hypothetical protein
MLVNLTWLAIIWVALSVGLNNHLTTPDWLDCSCLSYETVLADLFQTRINNLMSKFSYHQFSSVSHHLTHHSLSFKLRSCSGGSISTAAEIYPNISVSSFYGVDTGYLSSSLQQPSASARLAEADTAFRGTVWYYGISRRADFWLSPQQFWIHYQWRSGERWAFSCWLTKPPYGRLNPMIPDGSPIAAAGAIDRSYSPSTVSPVQNWLFHKLV